MFTCKSYITIPHHSFVFKRKNEVVKMSKQSHNHTISFMMTKLFMFLHIHCTTVNANLSWRGLWRRAEEGRGESRCPHCSFRLLPTSGSDRNRRIRTALAYRKSIQAARSSSGVARQSMQSSVLSDLDAPALVHKGEGKGLNTPFL